MIQRCENPNATGYEYYGARGIKVCEEWHEFTNFLEDMGEVPDGLEIDRINNEGDYEPANCQWATRSDQSKNRRQWEPNRKTTKDTITSRGTTPTLSDLN